MRIKLLLVDDAAFDRKVFEELLVKGETPWLRDIDLTVVSKALPNLEDYDAYDGIVLDHGMAPESGYEIARRIHQVSPRLPMMLLTGKAPEILEEDALLYVRYVAWKSVPPQTHAYFAYNIWNTLRAFVKLIADIKEARAKAGPS